MPYVSKKLFRKTFKEQFKKYYDLLVNLGTERMRRKDATFSDY
jgi:hypothetical protein